MLSQLHDALLEMLLRFEQNLPRDSEDITEDVERHVRVIALMIKTMNMMSEREENFKNNTAEAKPREDIIKELEHIFTSILAEDKTDKLPKPTK